MLLLYVWFVRVVVERSLSRPGPQYLFLRLHPLATTSAHENKNKTNNKKNNNNYASLVLISATSILVQQRTGYTLLALRTLFECTLLLIFYCVQQQPSFLGCSEASAVEPRQKIFLRDILNFVDTKVSCFRPDVLYQRVPGIFFPFVFTPPIVRVSCVPFPIGGIRKNTPAHFSYDCYPSCWNQLVLVLVLNPRQGGCTKDRVNIILKTKKHKCHFF